MTTAKVEPAATPKPIRRKAAIKREAREVPVSQFGRARALTSYGMTLGQVADLYEATICEIDRIIRRPRLTFQIVVDWNSTTRGGPL